MSSENAQNTAQAHEQADGILDPRQTMEHLLMWAWNVVRADTACGYAPLPALPEGFGHGSWENAALAAEAMAHRLRAEEARTLTARLPMCCPESKARRHDNEAGRTTCQLADTFNEYDQWRAIEEGPR